MGLRGLRVKCLQVEGLAVQGSGVTVGLRCLRLLKFKIQRLRV